MEREVKGNDGWRFEKLWKWWKLSKFDKIIGNILILITSWD